MSHHFPASAPRRVRGLSAPTRQTRSAAARRLPAVLLLAALGVAPGPASAQLFTLPGHFEAVPLPGIYTLPVGIAFAPDARIFLLEKPGPVLVLDPLGNAQAVPFIDLTAEVNNDHDRGLLGIALHPGFVADGGDTSWVYLLYTVSPTPPLDNGYNGGNKFSFSRLTRYKAVTNAGLITADESTRQILLGHQLADGSVPDGIASIHNSHSNGSMHFADDGSLMLDCGDGAHYDFQDNGGHDPGGFDDFINSTTGLKGPTPKVQDEGAFRSQDPRALSGKLLRIDPATGYGYPSNPFFDGDPTSNRSKVWALGLRNPYRMDLVPGTGATDPAAGHPNVAIIGDVGWNTWEEINVSKIGGENFGWPCYEGFLQQSGYQTFISSDSGAVTCHTAVTGTLTLPILAWHHSNAAALTPPDVYVDADGNPLPGFKGNCSIGGTTYTGGNYPAEYVGREFFADYAQGYIKTIKLDAGYNIVSVQDFASNTGSVVDIERSPANGDLYLCNLKDNRLYEIRYGTNGTPIAVASGNPTLGGPPLDVQFSSAGTSDPDNDPLTYDWDFGDGSAHSSDPNPQHDYSVANVYEATLTVQDPYGLTSSDGVQVAVGNAPPTATILSPLMASTYQTPTTIQLSGLGTDVEADPLTYSWQVDLYHADHIHPGTYLLSGPQASFDITESPEDDQLLYYRIELTVTDAGGLTAKAHVFIYPQQSVKDIAGTSQSIARTDELVPPLPTGGGNHDIEVIRDKTFPYVGNTDSSLQFDTFHNGDQGNDDWIGYALAAPPDTAFRFTGLHFQEGKHFYDGGWFKDFHIEVRNGGTWTTVPGVTVTPAYPFLFANQQYFDGINFQTYVFRFDPVAGDAIRLRGTPGGSSHYISCGELTTDTIDAAPFSPFADISAQGTIIAKLFSLVPPQPLGQGSQDPETIRNGTLPPVGSASYLAQYDTLHVGQQGNEDWIGYDFGGTRTFTRVVFQEGRNNPDGGAFVNLGLQVQQTAGGPWTDVPGLVCTPPYSGLNGVNYETFTLDFPPITGRALRLDGAPAGIGQYISVGELTVYGPALPSHCGFFSYGAGSGGANTLTLASATPPGLGLPVEIHAAGAVGPANGYLGLALGSASLPLIGGTFLLQPLGLVLAPVTFDATGVCSVVGVLPSDPVYDGASVYLQAFAFDQPAPATRFSNGLQMIMCAP